MVKNMAKATYCLAVFLAVLVIAVTEELYTDKFDHINVDDILKNEDLRNHYYKCFMDTGPCETEDQIYFKEHATEMFVTKCRKCTEIQKQNLEKIVVWYTENRPEEWNAMVQKLMDDAKRLNITPA